MQEDLFKKQIQLEKRMVSTGYTRYMYNVRTAENADRGADTGYANKLMKEYIPDVANYIKLDCMKITAGKYSKARKLLRVLDPYTAAYIGLRQVFNTFTDAAKLARVCVNIGAAIEDELRFQKFHAASPEYFEALIRDYTRRSIKDGMTIHRHLTSRAAAMGIQWESWKADEKMQVGAKILDAITSCTDLCNKEIVRSRGKTIGMLVPTDAALEWIQKFTSKNSLLYPDCAPCVVPPDPWVLNDQGGFWTPQMRSNNPMVKSSNKLLLERMRNPSKVVLDALNTLQSTAWGINTDVLSIMVEAWGKGIEVGLPRSIPYEIPLAPVPRDLRPKDMAPAQFAAFKEWKHTATKIHSDNKERISKCFDVVRCIQMAQEYKEYPEFWFVYQCDFRGRMYPCTSGISPQGADFNKALLRFAEGKPLGTSGEMWFLIDGANVYGVDKVPFKDRIAWVKQNSKRILSFVSNPFGDMDFWLGADKPWQFLAWAFEYRKYTLHGINTVSYLPIGLDGTCNGLQNYSAMLRDPVGGKATNLVPGDKPSDIYTEVAIVLSKLTVESTDPKLDCWKEYLQACGGTFPRGLTKRPVMTLPYGVTMHSCREYISEYVAADGKGVFNKTNSYLYATYLTPLLWKAMGEVVVAARSAMDWIQGVACTVSESNQPVTWWSPAGFPVVQDRRKTVFKRVKTEVQGTIVLSVRFDTADTDARKQQLACAPNFIHSMDASHAMFVLNAAREAGCTSFRFIHDDFGTHAADIDTFFWIIREEFVKMYTNNQPLWDLKECVQLDTGLDVPDPPPEGTLDLNEVLDSHYFFS